MLVFDHLCHHFDNAVIFNQLSFTIDAPRVLITGANGSGKTTLLLLAAGLIKPKAGRVSFRGQDVLPPHAKRWIGISANKVELPVFMTVQELLQFQAQQFAGVVAGSPAACFHAYRANQQHNKGGQQQSDRSAADVTDWVGEFGLKPFLRTKVGDLSLGNAKKLSLILALQHQPALLLLDEPSNGLDEQARAALLRVLTGYPGQVIVASHEPLSAGDLPMQHMPLASLIAGHDAIHGNVGHTA